MSAATGPRTDDLPASAQVVIVGAGIIGCFVGAELARAGAEVCVVDRAGPAAGSSSSGEGNLLASDKLPGPDLAFALESLSRWRRLGEELFARIEYREKGGLVVARTEQDWQALSELAERQRRQGLEARPLEGEELWALEPLLDRSVRGAYFYPGDAQVQPMLAVRALVAAIRRHGGRVVAGAEVRAAERGRGGELTALLTTRGRVAVGTHVVNAAGAWAGALSGLLGCPIPVSPRRGHVLVTEPVGSVTEHKVYESGYLGSVHDGDGEGSVSAVVESTAAGTMLLGSSREFVGFERSPSLPVMRAIAARAIALFPGLAGVRLMRGYVGFRPATPDRLPVLGADERAPSVLHATGHEGAGVGLAPATAAAIADLVLGRAPGVDVGAFSAARFAGQAAR
jgi:glycine/D-amino acid oxidase-like deaminating enzyme